MSRDRLLAAVVAAVAAASGTLMIAGSAGERRLGWALWPLLIVLPVLAGALRRRSQALRIDVDHRR
jgi:hypothetical protein